MNNNDFSVMLKAVLDKSGIQTELKQVQQIVSKYSIDVMPELKTASLRNQLKSVSKEMADDFNKTFGTNVKGNDIYKAYINQIKQAENAIKQEQKAQENLVNAMARGREQSEKAYQAEKKRQDLAQNNATNKALEQEYQQIQKINKALNENKVSSSVSGVSSKYSTLASVPESLKSDYSKLTSLSEQLNTSLGNKEKIAVWDEYEATLKSVNNQMKKAETEAGRLATEAQKITTTASMQNYLSKNTAISKEAKTSLNSWVSELKSGSDISQSKLDKMTNSFKLLDSAEREAGRLGLSFTDGLKEQAKTFTQWIGVSGAVMTAVQTMREMYQAVYDVDTVMTQLRMATGDTQTQVEDLMKSYAKLGSQLSSTQTDVATSATEWLKQGQSISDSNELVKDSIVLSKISGLSAADSTKYLTSAMKGYKVSVEDTLDVVDKLSAVDMASATDVSGLASAMSSVATNADIAGISMDKLLGYLAATGEVTQESMDSIGTAYNAIFARMGNIKLARLKDYQNSGEDLSDVETVLKGLNISLRDSDDTFRNFGDVLDEVASKWSGYSTVQQRAIAKAFAGTYHYEQFTVLMQNYGKATEYANTALSSSGTAMQKFSAYQDSMAARTAELENAFQSLSQTVMDSDFLKGLMDIGTAGVNGLDKVTGAVGILGTILGGVGVFAVVKFYKSLDILKLKSLESAGMLEGLSAAEIANASSTVGLSAAVDGLTISLKALALAHPILTTLLAVGALIGGTSVLFDKFTVSLDEAQESMSNAKSNFDSSTTEINSLNQEIADCTDSIKKLQDLADAGTISVADEKQLETLKNQNIELEKQLRIQQEKQKLSAIEEAKSASDSMNAYIESDYNQKTAGRVELVTPKEELQSSIDAYDDLSKQINDLNDSFLNGEMSQEKYDDKLSDLKDKQSDAEQRASDMNDVLASSVQAYTDLTNAGGKLTEQQKEEYEIASKANGEYSTFISTINGYSDLIQTTSDSIQTFVASTYEAVDATKALSSASDVFDNLKSAYEDFTDDGFVLAKTLESLPDEIKNLQGFDLFSQIVGDPTSGTEKIQQAFDDITKQYLLSENTLGGLVGASQSTVQSYIANLKEMGVANAEDVVNNAYNAINSENQLITNATQEYEDLYQKYLQSKNEADLDYLNNAASNNSQLANALGSTYSSDYSNWTSLLKDKALAYNQFVSAIKGSQLDLGGGSAALSYQGQAQAIVNEANGKTVKSSADKFSLTGSLTGGNVSKYTSEQVQSAQQYLNYVKQLGTMSDALKLDLSSVSTSFGTTFSPSSSSSSGSGSSIADAVEQTAQTIDYVQIRVQRLTDTLSAFKTAAENAFKSFASRFTAYGQAINSTTEQIQFQQQAYDLYMQKANSVGLADVYKNQINSGNLNIEDVYDDTLKQQIQDYQSYYESAQKCQQEIEELKQTQTELTQAKIETLITKYKNLAQVADDANTKIQNKIDLKESWGGTASVKNYTDMNKNIQSQIKNIKKQDDQLKALQKTVDKGSEKWYEYQQEINDNKSSISDLTKTMAENATAASQLASAKAKTKVEKYDTADELLKAKSDNATSASSANAYIESEIANIAKRQSAYNTAVSSDKSNLSSSSKSLTNTKSTKENKKILKQIKSAVKSKKEISDSLLNSALKLNDNGALYNKCVKYNAYLEAYATDKATADLYAQTSQSDKTDLAKEQFDNVQKQYENQLSTYSQNETVLNNQISLAEAQGKKVSSAYYNSLIANEQANQAKLVEERTALQNQLASIPAGTDEWIDAKNSIDAVTNAIDESAKSLVDYDNDLRQLKWDDFDDGIDKMKNLLTESDYYISLMEKQGKLVDDSGNFTDSGNATLALRVANYKEYMSEYQSYADEITRIKKEEDLSDENVIARLQELTEAQEQAVLSAEDEKQAMIDLATQGYDAQKSSLQDLIDTYKDLLSTKSDMYDYQNSIADKTKTITDLQKQLQAYSGDMSEENKATVQKLTVDLVDAQKDLQETETEKQTSEITDLLDGLYDDYSDFLDDKLDQTNTLIEELINSVSDSDTKSIVALLDSLPTNLSTELANLINTGNTDGLTVTGVTSVIKATGYATGTKRISSSMIAETQENGQELIYNASNGGLLTPLGEGDKVFTNAMTDNLWSLAQLSPSSLMSGLTTSSIPTVTNSSGGNSVAINLGGMVVNEASDANEIVNTMANALATNSKLQKITQEITVGKLSSNSNSLSARRYI